MHPRRQEQVLCGEEIERRPLWLELECIAPREARSEKLARLDPGGHCEAQSGFLGFFFPKYNGEIREDGTEEWLDLL